MRKHSVKPQSVLFHNVRTFSQKARKDKHPRRDEFVEESPNHRHKSRLVVTGDDHIVTDHGEVVSDAPEEIVIKEKDEEEGADASETAKEKVSQMLLRSQSRAMEFNI